MSGAVSTAAAEVLRLHAQGVKPAVIALMVGRTAAFVEARIAAAVREADEAGRAAAIAARGAKLRRSREPNASPETKETLRVKEARIAELWAENGDLRNLLSHVQKALRQAEVALERLRLVKAPAPLAPSTPKGDAVAWSPLAAGEAAFIRAVNAMGLMPVCPCVVTSRGNVGVLCPDGSAMICRPVWIGVGTGA